jgi:2-polyprenyl-6-methoxyphenol hydroxylase-like FAD-dependent oxidoreductase
MEEAMRATKSATIVGCGIAGPVLGICLGRAGVRVEVFEARREEETSGGAFLGVAPNGMHVLDALGVGEALRARGFVCRGFSFRNARGERIGTIDRREDRARLGAELVMIERAVLHRVLLDAARARGVMVRFGRRLEAIEDAGDAVIARFTSGAERCAGATRPMQTEARADVLIGCDGIRSTTRALVLPDSPAPCFTGLTDIAGIVHAPDAPLEVGWNEMYFGRRAFFGALKTDAGDVWWFHNAGAEDVAEAASAHDLRARVRDAHADDPPIIQALIDRTETLLGPFPLHDILTLPRWHRGRVCLIGDAAHATTPSAGQGASLALEDAMALARCLRETERPEAAFAAFEAGRRGRVEAIVRMSRRTGNTKAPSGPVGEWLRDRMLPLFLRFGARAQARAYAYREEALSPT